MDWYFVREALLPIVCFALLALLLCATVITPIMYLEGSAKSEWIAQTRGVELPWYRAAWLDVNIQDVDGELSMQK